MSWRKATSVVASESMEPLLMVGDKVIIKPLKSTDDVVISTTTDDRLTVSRDDVVGKVEKITPFYSKIDIIIYTFLLFDIIYIVFSFDKKQSTIINNSGNKN